jgi:predicted 2-oxoglutarate/Fe(II)-dependent dioxygenase YbiX
MSPRRAQGYCDMTEKSTVQIELTPGQRALVRQVIGYEMAELQMVPDALPEGPASGSLCVRPTSAFFQRLGIYLAPGFLGAEECARLRAEARRAEAKPGTVFERVEHWVDHVNENLRHARTANVAQSTVSSIASRLMKLRPTLERYLEARMTYCEPPQFVVYPVGGLFEPHPDATKNENLPESMRRRRASVIIFLNGEGSGPESYSGGVLTFYPPGDGLEQYGFPLTGEEGLLVAFRPELVHGVTPITSGERHAIVSFFVE